MVTLPTKQIVEMELTKSFGSKKQKLVKKKAALKAMKAGAASEKRTKGSN